MTVIYSRTRWKKQAPRLSDLLMVLQLRVTEPGLGARSPDPGVTSCEIWALPLPTCWSRGLALACGILVGHTYAHVHTLTSYHIFLDWRASLRFQHWLSLSAFVTNYCFLNFYTSLFSNSSLINHDKWKQFPQGFQDKRESTPRILLMGEKVDTTYLSNRYALKSRLFVMPYKHVYLWNQKFCLCKFILKDNNGCDWITLSFRIKHIVYSLIKDRKSLSIEMKTT